MQQLNQYVGASITYNLPQGDKVLDGQVMLEWLDKDEEGNYTKDEDAFAAKIKAFVAELAEETDTLGYPERLEIRRQALMSDLFITGVNAISMEGSLHWLDKVGNRIAPVAFGPRKVVIVAGRNKIVADRAQAEDRIRTIAAPQNVARHPGFRTPCARTGVCSDCNSPDRVCNTRMEMLRCWPAGRVLVVLIDQELGL